jgi:hypothetical protein
MTLTEQLCEVTTTYSYFIHSSNATSRGIHNVYLSFKPDCHSMHDAEQVMCSNEFRVFQLLTGYRPNISHWNL